MTTKDLCSNPKTPHHSSTLNVSKKNGAARINIAIPETREYIFHFLLKNPSRNRKGDETITVSREKKAMRAKK